MDVELPTWRLLAGCSSFTDLPNSVLHVWRLADPSALIQGKEYFEGPAGQPLYDTLTSVSGAPQLQLLEAMPYDPKVEPENAPEPIPSADGRFYFLWVELTLLPGPEKRAAFSAAAEALLAEMRAHLTTWTLIAAGSTLTGPPNTVMHLWRLQDPNALLDGMNWFGENNASYRDLARCCARQRQQLFTSMIYNPLGQNGQLSADDQKHANALIEFRDISNKTKEQLMPDVVDTNLVIYAYRKNDDPSSAGLFSIPIEVYTDAKYELTGGEAALPKYLLSQGTVVANMPNDQTGTGGFCYLLNIPALRPPKVPGPHPKLKLTPQELNIAIKSLASRTSDAEPGDAKSKELLDRVKLLQDK